VPIAMLETMPAAITSPAQMSPNAPEACAIAGDSSFRRSRRTSMIADVHAWAYFGLVGGGMYLYFGGRGILARAAMERRGLQIGSPQNVRLGYVFSAAWATMALVTIVAAIVSIES